MGKIILEFDNTTESDVATLALNVVSYWSEVDDVRDKMRAHFKYDEKTCLDEIYRMLCKIQDRYPLS